MPSPVRASILAASLAAGLLAAALSAAPAVATRAVLAAQVPSTCSPAVSLVNGGFEDPQFGVGVSIVNQSSIPGWSTTAGDGQIEIWHVDTPTAATGTQHAELNANQVSTLYQDVATTPGQILKWELQHRGRAGTDVMSVRLGSPSGPLVQQGANIADGNTAWGTYSGLYTVPAAQTVTRFAFVSVSSAGGSPSLGNFLDSISLGNAACVITTKSVANITRPGNDPVVGDVLEYTVTATNNGGVPATGAVVTDAVPAGTTFVPGSITGSAGSLTDALADDAGEYDAGAVHVRVGDGASAAVGGSIPAGEARSITFRATVDDGTVGSTVVNDASVSYVESLSGTPATSTSNTIASPVLPSADLEVSQTLDTTLSNGGTAQYTITVTNNGPQTAEDTELTSDLPLTGMTANDPDCTVTVAQLVCDFGSLPITATRQVVVTGTVPVAASGGTSYELTSTVTGSVYDPDTTNNNDLSIDALASTAGLSIDMAITNTSPGGAGRPAYEGDLLRVTYLVTNTGNVDLSGLTVTDPVFGSVTCTPTAITPTTTATCSADALYPVTAGDVRTGQVSSTATADANAAGQGGATVSDTTTAAINTGVLPVMALTGSSPQAGFLLAGILLLLGVSAMAVARRRARGSVQ